MLPRAAPPARPLCRPGPRPHRPHGVCKGKARGHDAPDEAASRHHVRPAQGGKGAALCGQVLRCAWTRPGLLPPLPLPPGAPPVEVVPHEAPNGRAHSLDQCAGQRDEAQLAGGGAKAAPHVLRRGRLGGTLLSGRRQVTAPRHAPPHCVHVRWAAAQQRTGLWPPQPASPDPVSSPGSMQECPAVCTL